ncbi:WYL domain-containing protein [Paenibacillus cellulosilyticus]|uniref:WYL domain-containing protein n=1 Tax=Paenibacillus cellulosilyticus TaxID=375489 RepID=A0A2V2YQV3_9BACL|nr:WYL domain-containing protein [Paenibacillus cellulosilyticus]PWV98680.1 WYL domain-containing protein [Paenibacillus cellulosilyticus]QKS43815.1 WYL domain-containing protein [Paenibacillus cellulosilyticus]
MNPFEKIFNYQMLSRLDESNAFALTTQERAWLKMLLSHQSAENAFTSDTLGKLRGLLADEAAADIRDIIIEKAKSREKHVYHPMLRSLRRIIAQGFGSYITYRLKHGGMRNQFGLPLKLEYSMVKREWYLLWYSPRSRMLMATKLDNLIAADAVELHADRAASLHRRASELLHNRKQQAVIEVVRMYNEELSRILYAFSCFDKTVSYDEQADLYHIHVTYPADEGEYLLSKIRFLGLRVRVAEGNYLKRRMWESSSKAIARYGIGE